VCGTETKVGNTGYNHCATVQKTGKYDYVFTKELQSYWVKRRMDYEVERVSCKNTPKTTRKESR